MYPLTLRVWYKNGEGCRLRNMQLIVSTEGLLPDGSHPQRILQSQVGSAIAEHHHTVNKSSLCVSTYGCLLRVKSPPHNAFSPFFNFRMLKDYSAADDK